MKQNDNNSKWLDTIRDEMLDFKADIPANGWEKVSSSLPSSGTSLSQKRWWAAAASLLLIIGAGGYMLVSKPASETIADNHPYHEAKPQIEEPVPEPIRPAEENTLVGRPYHQSKVVSVVAPALVDTITVPTETVMSEVAVADEELTDVDTIITPQHSSQPSELLYAMNEPYQQKKHDIGWSFGLNIAGRGMGNGDADKLYSDVIVGPFYGYEGLLSSDIITASSHHASWSVGLSAEKEILPRTTLESGVVYTLLTSQVTFSRSGVKSQRVHNVGIPLKVNYRFLNANTFHLYAGGGLMADYVLTATRDGKQFDMKPWQLSTILSVGGQYRLSNRLSLYIEPGLNWYFLTDKKAHTIRSQSPLYFNLRGGIRLSY